jgi:hypothetical protein
LPANWSLTEKRDPQPVQRTWMGIRSRANGGWQGRGGDAAGRVPVGPRDSAVSDGQATASSHRPSGRLEKSAGEVPGTVHGK